MISWQEKRKYKRAFIKLMVEYRGKNLWQMVEAKDISADGMFIVAEKTEPPLTTVDLMFELEKDNLKKNIVAEGVVAWNRPAAITDEKGETQPAGMGIMFTKIFSVTAKDLIKSALT
jgi:hypothetical protein